MSREHQQDGHRVPQANCNRQCKSSGLRGKKRRTSEWLPNQCCENNPCHQSNQGPHPASTRHCDAASTKHAKHPGQCVDWQPNNSRPQPAAANMDATPQASTQGQRWSTRNPTVSNLGDSKLATSSHVTLEGQPSARQQHQDTLTSIDPTGFFRKKTSARDHAARAKQFHIIRHNLRQKTTQGSPPSRSGRNSNSLSTILNQANGCRPRTPMMKPIVNGPSTRSSKGTIINVNPSHDARVNSTTPLNMTPTKPSPNGHDDRAQRVALRHRRTRQGHRVRVRLVRNPSPLSMPHLGDNIDKLTAPSGAGPHE